MDCIIPVRSLVDPEYTVPYKAGIHFTTGYTHRVTNSLTDKQIKSLIYITYYIMQYNVYEFTIIGRTYVQSSSLLVNSCEIFIVILAYLYVNIHFCK